MRGFRDKCLNETLYSKLNHVRAEITVWKQDYNQDRPHSSLGNNARAEFAKKMALKMQAV